MNWAIEQRVSWPESTRSPTGVTSTECRAHPVPDYALPHLQIPRPSSSLATPSCGRKESQQRCPGEWRNCTASPLSIERSANRGRPSTSNVRESVRGYRPRHAWCWLSKQNGAKWTSRSNGTKSNELAEMVLQGSVDQCPAVSLASTGSGQEFAFSLKKRTHCRRMRCMRGKRTKFAIPQGMRTTPGKRSWILLCCYGKPKL